MSSFEGVKSDQCELETGLEREWPVCDFCWELIPDIRSGY